MTTACNEPASANLAVVVEAEMSPEKKEAIGKALGRLASGVFVVTGTDTGTSNGAPIGMLATWISQASFNPPLVSVAVNKDRAILGSLQPGAAFNINVLAKSNNDLFKKFAKPASQETADDRFAGLDLCSTDNGCPAFSDAVSFIECVVEQVVDAGDHCLAIGRVTGGALLNPDAEPMVHLRRNGFQY